MRILLLALAVCASLGVPVTHEPGAPVERLSREEADRQNDQQKRLDRLEDNLSVIARFLRQSAHAPDVDPTVAKQLVHVSNGPTRRVDMVQRAEADNEEDSDDDEPAVAPTRPIDPDTVAAKNSHVAMAMFEKNNQGVSAGGAIDTVPNDPTTVLDVNVPAVPRSFSHMDLGEGGPGTPTRPRSIVTPASAAGMPEVTDIRIKPIRGRESVICPGQPECTGHGMCDNGICRCDYKWSGRDCSNERCYPACVNGDCVNGECACYTGYMGVSCEELNCKSECSNGGQCVGGKCECAPGWQGEACSERICLTACGEHGTVNGTNCLCDCDPGWGGPECTLVDYFCPYECLNGATCNNGTCVCTTGFAGLDCGLLANAPAPCAGGSSWSTSASSYIRTCSNLHDQDDAPPEQLSIATTVARCACPESSPIWDSKSRTCVSPLFCTLGICGDMPAPTPGDVVLSTKRKEKCDFKVGSPTGTCQGCVDESQAVSTCWRMGADVAERAQNAARVVVGLFPSSDVCLEGFTDRTVTNVVKTNTPPQATNELFIMPEGVPYTMLSLDSRKPVGTVKIPTTCVGEYSASIIIFYPDGTAETFGDCDFNMEPPSCPVGMNGVTCSGHGSCLPGYFNKTRNGTAVGSESKKGYVPSRCVCDPDYLEADCSSQYVWVWKNGTKTKTIKRSLAKTNITTTLDIPVDASIASFPDHLVVSFDDEVGRNIVYVFYYNGSATQSIDGGPTRKIAAHHPSASHSIPKVTGAPEEESICPPTMVWSHCSAGCLPTCRNPFPRCTPSCVQGACQCPPDKPYYDETVDHCVALNDCGEQVSCPGVGVVCSDKGACVDGVCLCAQGFHGTDCSVAEYRPPRSTNTTGGTTDDATPCAFPFYYGGRKYTDCTTDFDTDGAEWCSLTEQWEGQWGYCSERGSCPGVAGLECNGQGSCKDGVCLCTGGYSGPACQTKYTRFTEGALRQKCSFPFVGPDMKEYTDCIEGSPVVMDAGANSKATLQDVGSFPLGGSIVKNDPRVEEKSWCLTKYRFDGISTFGFCLPPDACSANCSAPGGECDIMGSANCVCKPGFAGAECSKLLTEREILSNLYTATHGSEWNRRAGWGVNDLCGSPGWAGISCNAEGKVTRITIDSNNMHGTIPSDLAALTSLQALDLSNNFLTGTFPEEIVKLGKSLRLVAMTNNMLVGQWPVIPAYMAYADFSENYMTERYVNPHMVLRVTNGQGPVPAYTPCKFPFEFNGTNYTACSFDYLHGEMSEPWCSTTSKYEGKWGHCAPVGTCAGEGSECSDQGKCKKVAAPTGLGAECECDAGFMGLGCEQGVVRVTKTSMIGEVESFTSKPCAFPFTYNGVVYKDCTTDGSETGQEWCYLTNTWERRWGFCDSVGKCPGVKEPCSGNGVCNKVTGTCTCHEGWAWNDCSHKVQRVTNGTFQTKGTKCHFPFSLNGVVYTDCTTAPSFTGDPYCAVEGGELTEHERWDFCAKPGACPGSYDGIECSGRGECQEGECICEMGFSGDACEQAMSTHDILVQLFRSTGGQRWLDTTSWEDGQYCDWFGITCDDNLQPIMIRLDNNNLDGTMPDTVGLIYSLKLLDVSGNRLGGTVPSTLRDLPELKTLLLTRNQFVGPLAKMRFNNATVRCEQNCIESIYCQKGECAYPF